MTYETLQSTYNFEKPVNDYLRVMTASPETAIADPSANTEKILEIYQKAKDQQAEVLVLPELSITGYSTADLFFNQHVIDRSLSALQKLAEATKDGPAMVVGLPVQKDGLLYNCAGMLAGGEITGLIPKSYLPNYNEFYEKRWFSSGANIGGETIKIGAKEVPFGTDLIFDINGTKTGVEICEDLYAVIPPSSKLALAGAEIILNPSASNELIGKKEYRRRLVSSQAGSLICAYVYTSAGRGESIADVVYGGHQMVAELGRITSEVAPLGDKSQDEIVFDIDRRYITHDRTVNKTYADQASEYRKQQNYRIIEINTPAPNDDRLLRKIDPHPFVPSSKEHLDERCQSLMNMMSEPLAQSVEENNSGGIVIGLSGGLDSTLALLTAMMVAEKLGKPPNFIHAVTMPGPASSDRTQSNAVDLAEAYGATQVTIPISEMTDVMLQAIGHDGMTEDIAFENTQARIRKTLLLNYANLIRGLDLGTGDMSESAQGWCTFNGDHMSMRNQNAGIPKTLVSHLVKWYANHQATPAIKTILLDILDTPISPELTGNGDLTQTTESLIGPYELHDFFLYELQRHGSTPSKIGYLATRAFEGTYDQQTIGRWLESFLDRFTKNQWKRESQPNGTKYGTVSLSQRSDLRMAPNTSATWWK